MLEILILWGYMLFVNASVGVGVLKLVGVLTKKKDKRIRWMSAMMAGIVTVTVYAETWSLFWKVGMLAHLLLLFFAVLSAVLCRDAFARLYQGFRRECISWDGFLFLLLALAIAFCTSRGIQHTDTGIYHAQTIRWYEEYGLVKGLANLQQHFGYNSAYLGFASVFSMKWLLGRSLHVTTGFLAFLLCGWALTGLKDFKRHENNLADVSRFGILIYTMVNVEGLMSPATDYAAMYLSLYVIVRWAELVAERAKEADLSDYALLCVLAVCVATYKLSAGILVLLALYPAVRLVREGQWRQTGVYLGAGVLVLLPFLARNVLLSGWLVYPYAGIDWFFVDWKVPAWQLQHDSDQIKVWGKCLFDVAKADAPLWEWLPLWWEAKDTYEKMLIEANLAAVCVEALGILHTVWHGKRVAWERVILHLTVFVGNLAWFWMAPFIRYGLAFLLEFPLLAIGSWLKRMENGGIRILAGFGSAVVYLLLCCYFSYYTVADMNWVKAHFRDPAYVRQQDYDRVETASMQVGSLTVYYPVNGDNISYHAFPATACKPMAQRTGMRGSRIEDGFYPLE